MKIAEGNIFHRDQAWKIRQKRQESEIFHGSVGGQHLIHIGFHLKKFSQGTELCNFQKMSQIKNKCG